MGVTDFLFEGKPPKSVTTYGQTIKDVPKWMSDYTQGLIARANVAAAEPYIPYGGPRIAPFTPTQQAAFGMAGEAAGAYQPFLEGATAGTTDVLMGPTPLQQASPYLYEGTADFPSQVEQYINPYLEHVLGRQEDLATRTLEEKFLPRLQRTFAGAGQYGSRGGFGSMEDIGVRGVRDIQENLEKQRLATLGTAYGQAADIQARDQARMMQAAGLAGQLGLGGGELGLRGAAQLGALGEAAQQLGLRGAAAMEAIGQQEQALGQQSLDLAYKDFLEQRDLPFARTRYMSEILRGLPPSAVPTAATTTERGPAQVYQPSGLAQIAGAYGTYRGLTGARGGEVKKYQMGGLAAAQDDVIDLGPTEYEVVGYG